MADSYLLLSLRRVNLLEEGLDAVSKEVRGKNEEF
jgi:hypothetical protein